MRILNGALAVVFAGTLLIESSPAGADQPIAGKKLLIKNPPSGPIGNRVIHLAKDPTVTVGAAGSSGDPQCTGAGAGGASSLRVLAAGGAGDLTIDLPCEGWTTNASNTQYKYTDASGTTCKQVLVKDGVLAKAVCGGMHLAIDVDPAMSPVALVTTLNSERYCSEFGGTAVKDGSDDQTLLRRNASPPVSCPDEVTGSCPFVTKWGSFGSGDGQFISPTGVAVDASGNVYVTDYGNDRIQKFTAAGAFVTKWGSFGSGNGQLNGPLAVAVDVGGNVYVVDALNSRIQKFLSDGTFVTKWGSLGSATGQFDFNFGGAPGGGIVADASGNVYVADYSNDRIQKFMSDGTFLSSWGSSGTGDGQFNGVSAVAVDATGNVYVADIANNRVQKFTSTGVFLIKWGSSGNGDGEFNACRGIAVDAAGIVYASERLNYRVQRFLDDGTFLDEFGSAGSADGEFDLPEKLALDSSGALYVADINNSRIQKFDCP